MSANLLRGASSHVFVALSDGAASISQIDATTGAAQHVLPTVPGAYNLTLSPDGKQAYVLAPSNGDGGTSGNNSVTVWDLATGALVATYALTGSPWELYFSPDGHFAYVAGSDETVKGNEVIDTLHLFTLDTLTRKVVADQPFPALNGYSGILQNAIAPDAKLLYIPTSPQPADAPEEIAVFALPSLKKIKTVTIGPTGTAITGLAASKDGKSLLIGSYVYSEENETYSIATYSTSTFQQMASATPIGQTSEILLSPDGQTAYTSVENRTVPIYQTNVQIVSLPSLQLSTGALLQYPSVTAISPDGTKLLAGNQIIDLSNESVLVNVIESLTGINPGQFSPGNNSIWLLNQGSSQLAVIPEGATTPSYKLATGELPSWIAFGPGETIDVLDGDLTIINSATGHVAATVPLGSINLQEAEFLAYGSGQIYVASSQGAESYNPATQQFTTLALPVSEPPEYTMVNYMAATSNGSNLYVEIYFLDIVVDGLNVTTGGIMNFDTATNQQAGFTPLSPNGAFVISADGSTIYANTAGGNAISVIDTRSNTVTHVFPIPGYLGFDSMTLSPDGSALYALDRQVNKILIIDTATGQTTGSYSLTYDPTAMAITPDGLALYLSNSGTKNVTAIDTATGIQSSIYVGSPSRYIAIH